MSPPSPARPRHRVVAGLLLAMMGVGSLVLWIGVPAGSVWLASKVTENAGQHFILALVMTVSGMLVVAIGLAWINGLYIDITGAASRRPEDPPWRVRGPLEPLLAWSFAIALVALFVWFFVFAENPSRQVI